MFSLCSLCRPILRSSSLLTVVESQFGLFDKSEVGTEWAESTAREKTGQMREKTASDRAMEVNSSRSKSPLFQRVLAERPLPERQ
jgi:hypothetical protein